MNRLSVWWRKVFGEPAPLEYSARMDVANDVKLAPERQAVIDDIAQRQHDQANAITAATGRAYVTQWRQSQGKADGQAVRNEREFWERTKGKQ